MKTAVEWLLEQYVNKGIITIEDIEQAQKMEKEQIENAYEIGFADAWDDARYDDEPTYIGAEQYYNETFKTN